MVLVAVAMTNQIAIVVRLNLDNGRVTGQVYRHLNGTAIPYNLKVRNTQQNSGVL